MAAKPSFYPHDAAKFDTRAVYFYITGGNNVKIIISRFVFEPLPALASNFSEAEIGSNSGERRPLHAKVCELIYENSICRRYCRRMWARNIF